MVSFEINFVLFLSICTANIFAEMMAHDTTHLTQTVSIRGQLCPVSKILTVKEKKQPPPRVLGVVAGKGVICQLSIDSFLN